jgi:RNA polymerase sigma-54 factor
MLKQRLQQKMQQKLSPQQIQLMKLLQLPVMELEQRIKKEIEENPVLEDMADIGTTEDDDQETNFSKEDSEDQMDQNSEENEKSDEDEFTIEDFSEYDDDDDIPAYKLYANNKSRDDETPNMPIPDRRSFFDHLHDQLPMLVLDDKQEIIAEFIIGNLNGAGYLNRTTQSIVDDLLIIEGIEVSEEEVEKVLKKIQTLDPSGVGARNLQECLLIQLHRFPKNDTVELAISIIENCMDEFTKKHYHKILSKLKITEEQLKDAEKLIVKLNPKPGNSSSESAKNVEYVTPDFVVYVVDDKVYVNLTSKNMPELRVKKRYSSLYNQMATSDKQSDKEVADYVKNKIESANNFIYLIQQRMKTLINTMQTIVDMQYEFFLTGDERNIKPMVLIDIAEKIDMNISTVSRVVNSKYVSTPYGTYLLKYFFSESVENEFGEEISTIEIKTVLEQCIAEEDKSDPLTDDQLMELMKEKGYPIARRTVAKYRQQLKIPVARLRKQI